MATTQSAPPPFDFQWAAADYYWRPAAEPQFWRESAGVANSTAMVAAGFYFVGTGQALRSFHGAAHRRACAAHDFRGRSFSGVAAARGDWRRGNY